VPDGKGGVGALTFDADGHVIDYKMILKGTSMNCGGGKTYWNTWVSCEEEKNGQIYETDPFGIEPPQLTQLGGYEPGKFESVAYDNRELSRPYFYVTKDEEDGEIRRFQPNRDVAKSGNYSRLLTTPGGKFKYLVLKPFEDGDSGTFYWSSSIKKGKESAKKYFTHCEGIDVRQNDLFFISKKQRELFILDLDKETYRKTSTKGGKFKGHPDQINKIVDHNDLLFFTEDGDKDAGIHARDFTGRFFTIVEGDRNIYSDETTGIAFSPDHKHLYFSFQDDGVIFDVWRTDGYPFTADYLTIKYH